jgi:hypothetical protein
MSDSTPTLTSRRATQACAITLAAFGTLAAAPATHAASIWTPVASGTTETITAVAYRADKTVLGTANGKIFSGGVQRANVPGQAVVDLELNPAGTTAIAILDSGKALRSIDGGATWSVPLQLQTYNFPGSCQTSPAGAVGMVNLPSAPTAIRFASDTTAYITSNVPGSILRTANAGASWAEISRKSNQTCVLHTAEPLADVAPIQGSDSVYFMSKYFGNTWFTSDALASTPSDRSESVNCYDQRPSVAVDTTNGTRLAAGDGCTGTLSLQYSEDSGANYNRPTISPETAAVNGINDVDFTGGTIVWAGKGGDVFTSRDGRTAYAQRVEGADATRDWKSVSAYSANNVAIGGTGGALYVTAVAATIPDVVSPSGTINDPGAVTAGVAKAFSANLLDEAGGTGIDPASIRWTATGIPEASGNPATITFPSAGFYTLTVRFKDRAGNAGDATRSFVVSGGVGSSPDVPVPAKAKTVGPVLAGVPPECVASGAYFSTSMALRRKVVIRGKVATLRRVDFFVDGRRVKVDTAAPFRQVLTVLGAAGSKHRFQAVGYLKRKGNAGAATKRTVNSSFSICS